MKIYFLGICGTAMGNAALLARQAGHDVLGSDTSVYPPMSTVLSSAGIEIHEAYDAARLERLKPDLVVIGNAMSRGNAEIEWLLDTRAIRFTSLPAFLYEHVLASRRNIVIAGTHGKTTTTALTAFLLRENGRDPGFLIGGVPQDPPMGNHLGTPADPFVIEGDEYDSAFFDKRSKFIHYAPHVAVINNLEFDHADIFRDLADVQRTFMHLSRIVPRSGWIVVNGDDPNLLALGPMTWTRVIKVGTGEGNALRIVDFNEGANGATFRLVWRGATWAEIAWSQPGLFNARNAAMAALAAGLALHPEDPTRLQLASLEKFRGVKRRQEILVDRPTLKVIEDFGHHPTALAETLHSFRARYPGFTIHAAFEPRSNTSRTRIMQSAFMRALAQADDVYLGAIDRPEQMKAEDRFDVGALMEFLDAQGVHGHTAATNADLLAAMVASVRNERTRPQLVVFFTNGSFGGIIPRFVASIG